MSYKPLEIAVGYLVKKYQSVKYALLDAGQKISDSLNPPSGLELALVPSGINAAYLGDSANGDGYSDPQIYFFAKKGGYNTKKGVIKERREKKRKSKKK